MNARISRLLVATAIAGLVLIGGTPTTQAAENNNPCPASPNYSPDFSLNQGCVAVEGTAAIVPNFLQLTTSAA